MATAANSIIIKADTRTSILTDTATILSAVTEKDAVVNDIFLQPEAGFKVPLVAGWFNIVFPVVGSLMLNAGNEDITELLPEHVYCTVPAPGAELVVENPFPDEMINLLHIAVDLPGNTHFAKVCDISITEKNRLFRGSGAAACISAGVYDSRTKDVHSLSAGKQNLLTYIINGSFDFEERLMEYRDGLYQWQLHQAEFEALSEAAIILMIDC